MFVQLIILLLLEIQRTFINTAGPSSSSEKNLIYKFFYIFVVKFIHTAREKVLQLNIVDLLFRLYYFL